MINRYLGNKQSILDPIIAEVNKICKPGDWVCDIFAGTLSVSMALKGQGYHVISNDISRFSYSFGMAYLKNNFLPQIDLKQLGIDPKPYVKESDERIEKLLGLEGFHFLNNESLFKQFRLLVIVCQYLSDLRSQEQLPSSYRVNYFFDTYTEDGANSQFKSNRGTSGKRKFFTPENGHKLDFIINQIKYWYDFNLIDKTLYHVLLSVLAESVEKVSNTQGTFHDFQRDEYDSRALKKLYLRLPPFDEVIKFNKEHIVGKERDSLDFIKEMPSHKLLYIDPPYNFRQYTSYYFMLNLICGYCEITSLADEFANVEFVRGQNMSRDFKSTFCQKSQFINSIRQLIKDAKAEYVLLSYFDGRNHSEKGAPKGETNSIESLVEFFAEDLFVENSFNLIPIKRLNYQSFNGHKARELNEYLFLAKKTSHELVR